MQNKTKVILLAAILSTVTAVLVAGGQIAVAGQGSNSSDNAIPLKEAKLNIEHNAEDNDTGFQGFLDSEGWNRIRVIAARTH